MFFDAARFGPSTRKPESESPHLIKSFKKRVLIVESNLQNADEMANMLTGADYDVAIAGDGRTTLMFLGDTSPDLLLISTHLPDMTGYHLTEILRAAGQYSWRLRHVNILYLTTRDKVVNHRMVGAPESLVTEYLFKPVTEKELLEKVAKGLAEHPSVAARRAKELREAGTPKRAPRPYNIYAQRPGGRNRRLR